MKRLVIIALLFMVGCGEVPTPNATKDAKATLGLLFEHNGIQVYRFWDEGRYHYYAVDLRGRPVESFTAWTESCGKNCTRTVHDSVMTLQ
jgi:hypothetical protein